MIANKKVSDVSRVANSRRAAKFVVHLVTALLISGVCAGNARAAGETGDYVMLVPDWKNDVVHVIGVDGSYDGDFLDTGRSKDPTIGKVVWQDPQGILFLGGEPARFWLASERAISEWGADGKYRRTIYQDTQMLEDPSGIRRIGDEVFVLSADKKQMLVFDLDGARLRVFGNPAMDRGKDFVAGPDGMIYVATSIRSADTGLVTVWNPAESELTARPMRSLVAPDSAKGGITWVSSLAFDDDGDLLVTDFTNSRLERWDLDANKRVEVMLDAEGWGAYRELARGPDGLVYLAGPAGIYRFDSRAHSADLKDLTPFFDSKVLDGRLSEEFSPAQIIFVLRSILGQPGAATSAPADE